MDDEQTIVTIPTELTRRDTWWIFGIAAAFTMYPLWAILNQKAPIWLCLGIIGLTLVWVVTNAPMAEVRGIGPITVFIRNKLGERDVHEWLLAFLHYVRLVHVPRWRAACVAFWNSLQRRASSLRHWASASIRCWPWPIASWASAIHSSWSGRRARWTMAISGRGRRDSSDTGTS